MDRSPSGHDPDCCSGMHSKPHLHLCSLPQAGLTVHSILLQVRLLAEDGQADVACRDRWGKTALEEAQRVGATSVVAYLEQRDGRLQRKSESK